MSDCQKICFTYSEYLAVQALFDVVSTYADISGCSECICGSSSDSSSSEIVSSSSSEIVSSSSSVY